VLTRKTFVSAECFAAKIRKGQVLRIVDLEGQQVGRSGGDHGRSAWALSADIMGSSKRTQRRRRSQRSMKDIQSSARANTR
jgi:hypothetical protein